MLHPKISVHPQITAILHATCLFSLMLCANLCVTCGVWCTMFSFISNASWSSYDISISLYVACLNPCMMCLKIHLHRSLSKFFLHPSCYVVWAKSYIHAQNYTLHGQIHLLTFQFDHSVIFRHGFSLWSNLHQVPYMN